MTNTQGVSETGPDWTYFVALGGEAGRRWVEEFSQGEPARLENWMQQSLELLYSRRIQEGCELLHRVETSLPDLPASAVTSVLYHRFLAVLAYAQYCRSDFDRAERLLTESHQKVQQMIERHPFLLPLANRCSDLHLQRIRISRSQRRWEEMAERIEVVRQILRDEMPLCTLGNGTSVYFATLVKFYDSLPGLSKEEISAIRAVFDPDLRLRQFEVLVSNLYMLPGFIIQYP
jgi:hypothetical protein